MSETKRWSCPECDRHDFSTEEFEKHIKEVHDIKSNVGKRSLVMHINRRPKHTYQYQWDIEGMTFFQFINC